MDDPNPKILIIRLSAIGDIVLTSPVVRCLKKQIPNCEIHFLTKPLNVGILQNSPYINKVFDLQTSSYGRHDMIKALKKENYDYVIDLQKNLRSRRICLAIGKKATSFAKLNWRKWVLVHFKKNIMPDIHIVDRYFQAVKHLNIINDHKGLDYFLTEEDYIPNDALPMSFQEGYIVIAVGSKHETKQIPLELMIRICQKIHGQILLIGDINDKVKANKVENAIGSRVFNGCGAFSISQTASLIDNSLGIITADTGAMHIAAARKKNIISIWGNTVKEFGMYPYMPEDMQDRYCIMEVEGLKCRPCSKLGFSKCPKKHFDCMRLQDVDKIAQIANSWFDNQA